jgi:hypothetical protein
MAPSTATNATIPLQKDDTKIMGKGVFVWSVPRYYKQNKLKAGISKELAGEIVS